MRKIAIFLFGVSLSLFLGNVIVTRFLLRPSSTPVSAVYEVERVEAHTSPTPTPPETPAPKLSIESIFGRPPYVSTESDVILFATGDIIPARVTDSKIRVKGADFPFEKIDSTLQQADIVIGNLEAPLVSSCPAHLEGMVFCGQPAFAGAMKKANVTVATLENNHIFNKGVQGRQETITHLDKAGVSSVISGSPLILQVKGLTIGVIAVNGVGPRINVSLIKQEIDSLKDKTDVVIVAPHWGKEYTYLPERAAGIAPDDPRTIAHEIIDAGADLILGNHPHWVQGVEMYKDGFITYAHGNFIFDQEWSKETKEGVIGSYIFRNKKLVHVSFIPLVIEGFAQPRPADEKESLKILDAMKESSMALLK